jgi:hypothetical protein
MLLALAFVTVVMVVVVALVGFAQAGTRSVRGYEIERTKRYAVNSALETTVAALVGKPTMGTTDTAKICLVYDIPNTATNVKLKGNGGGAAYLTVECRATPGVTYAAESDGGQGPRDVTISVYCRTDPAVPEFAPSKDVLNCGTGSGTDPLAVARVRYEVDYSKALDARAVVPKVVTWEVRA